MKKFFALVLACAFFAPTLIFAGCGEKEIIKYVDREVEKIIEVPVEIPCDCGNCPDETQIDPDPTDPDCGCGSCGEEEEFYVDQDAINEAANNMVFALFERVLQMQNSKVLIHMDGEPLTYTYYNGMVKMENATAPFYYFGNDFHYAMVDGIWLGTALDVAPPVVDLAEMFLTGEGDGVDPDWRVQGNGFETEIIFEDDGSVMNLFISSNLFQATSGADKVQANIGNYPFTLPLTGYGIDANMFDGYWANYGNAEKLGIVKVNGKNVLARFNPNGTIGEVSFQNGNKTIIQSIIRPQFDKLYVTENFIYFNLVTGTPTRSGDDYDKKNYLSNSTSQSYVIVRATNKIYSLSQLSNIASIENNVLKSGNNYYLLSMAYNEIILTDLVPNKNISISNVFVDAQGTVYVVNNAVNAVQNGIVYLTGATTYALGIADDGRFYRTTIKSYIALIGANTDRTIQVYDVTTNSWICPNTLPMRLGFSQEILIKNGYVYAQSGSGGIYRNAYETTSDAMNLTGTYDTYTLLTGIVKIVGNNLYRFIDGTLSITDGVTTTQVATDLTTITSFGTYLIATKETLDGTQKFMITATDAGVATVTPYVEVTYEYNVLAIYPII